MNRHVAKYGERFSNSQAKWKDTINCVSVAVLFIRVRMFMVVCLETWDYELLGVQLKRNIMNLWRMFVDERDDIYGARCAILMNRLESEGQ